MPRPVSPGDRASTRPDGRGDVIDVEVIWEEVDEPATRSYGARPGRTPIAPLRVMGPGVAVAAYRNAASTRSLPHQRVDVFA
jgi:hypothetical protein